MRVLYIHWIYTWLLDVRKAWAANIAIEWLLRKNFKQHFIDTESENQKSGLINLFYILHSACPCKNYGLKCTPELKPLLTLNVLFFFYFVCNLRDQQTKQKKNDTKKHLAAVFDCRTIILLLFSLHVHTIETIFTILGGSIRPVWKRSSILYVHIICTPDIYVAIQFT